MIDNIYNQLSLLKPEVWLGVIALLLIVINKVRQAPPKPVIIDNDRYWRGKFEALECEACEHQRHLQTEIIWLRRMVSPITPPTEPEEE